MINNMELWLIWKQPSTRRRYKIGVLTCLDNDYTFRYSDEIDDALKEGFICFPGFENIDETYKSETLSPNISSRLPNKKRPDYEQFLKSYELDKNATELEILSSTKGKLVTDNYEFVKAFNEENFEFDVVGTRHCKDIKKSFEYLKPGKKLELLLDKENKHDAYAIKVLINDIHIGFVPRYYSKELSNLLSFRKHYNATIKSVNFENTFSDEVVILVIKVDF